jgi:hypothetical protein
MSNPRAGYNSYRTVTTHGRYIADHNHILFSASNIYIEHPALGLGERMNCPKCGKEMEHGFQRAESFIGGVKWMPERSSKSLGLESLAKPDPMGFCYLEGYRCRDCHNLLVQY